MKNSKLLFLVLLVPFFASNPTINETTLLNNEGIKINEITRKLNSSEINFSQTYVQYGNVENKDYIRFVTAFKLTDNITSIKYLRHVEGVEDKTFTVNTIYKTVSSNDEKVYYDGNNLTSTKIENDYYFACYSAELNNNEFKNKTFSLSFIINDNVYNLTSTSYSVLSSNDTCVAFFKNEETLLQKCIVKKGDTPIYTGEIPTKEDDHQYDFSWDKEINSINEDTIYNAKFTKKHIFNEGTIVKNPTCLEAGEKKYTCSIAGCNEEKIETIDSLGHHLNKVERVEPTETTDGSLAYYECSTCKNKYSDEQGKNLIDNIRIIRGKRWHLEDALEVSDQTITEKDGVIYNEGTKQDTHITFGDRENNASQVIEFDINVSKWKNEWSNITFMYRRWDNNTTYKMIFSENKVEVVKAYWNNGAQTKTLDTITGSFLKENKTSHVKIMSRGWDKTFMIDDKVLSHITESDYCAGNFAIYAWETPTYSISNLISRNYQNDAETMANDFPEIWLNKNV